MRIRTAFLFAAMVIAAGGLVAPAHAQAIVSAGAGGIFPSGTSFNGVPLNGLQSGYGVDIAANGTTVGQFCTILLGVSLTGTCTINMGDGSVPLLGVPFTATVTTDANDQGTIGLFLGQTSLPNATVNQGSMTIR